jgi:hypothetical protein
MFRGSRFSDGGQKLLLVLIFDQSVRRFGCSITLAH